MNSRRTKATPLRGLHTCHAKSSPHPRTYAKGHDDTNLAIVPTSDSWLTGFTLRVPQHSMFPSFANRRAESSEQRKQNARYLAKRMAPMIRALLLMAGVLYAVAMIVSLPGLTTAASVWGLLLVLPLALIALAARRTQKPAPLSLLALACLFVLEVGISVNAVGVAPGQAWIMLGLLLPVASSVIWSGRWDFIAAMTLCALGPLSVLLLGSVDPTHIDQYIMSLGVAIMVSIVLRAFMARTLIAQFHLEQRLRQQANTDGLTGLLQRNRFLVLARSALVAAYSEQQTASMLYVDADHFKQINDDYGHAAGDAVLSALASALRTHSRPTDLIGRMGGEEFALLLPGVGLQQAADRAEQLRLAASRIQQPNGPLTISIGIADCTGEECAAVEVLLARADQAMRQAKTSGRDRTVLAATARSVPDRQQSVVAAGDNLLATTCALAYDQSAHGLAKGFGRPARVCQQQHAVARVLAEPEPATDRQPARWAHP